MQLKEVKKGIRVLTKPIGNNGNRFGEVVSDAIYISKTAIVFEVLLDKKKDQGRQKKIVLSYVDFDPI